MTRRGRIGRWTSGGCCVGDGTTFDDVVSAMVDGPGVVASWMLTVKVAEPDDQTSVYTMTDERMDPVTHLGLVEHAAATAKMRYFSGGFEELDEDE